MKAWITENSRRIFTVLISALVGASVGYVIGNAGTKLPEEQNGAADAAVNAETDMLRIVHFEACAHELSTDMLTDAYLGYTREEMAAHFPEASIIVFSENSVKLMQVSEGYCPKHYVLRLRDDGSLHVLHTNGAFLQEELVMLIHGESAQIDSSEKEMLMTGIPFDSLEEIDAYMESISS